MAAKQMFEAKIIPNNYVLASSASTDFYLANIYLVLESLGYFGTTFLTKGGKIRTIGTFA